MRVTQTRSFTGVGAGHPEISTRRCHPQLPLSSLEKIVAVSLLRLLLLSLSAYTFMFVFLSRKNVQRPAYPDCLLECGC